MLAPGVPLRYALPGWLMGSLRFASLRDCPGMRVAKRNAREEKDRPFDYLPQRPPDFRNLRRSSIEFVPCSAHPAGDRQVTAAGSEETPGLVFQWN